jgi:hypothetical protein
MRGQAPTALQNLRVLEPKIAKACVGSHERSGLLHRKGAWRLVARVNWITDRTRVANRPEKRREPRAPVVAWD